MLFLKYNRHLTYNQIRPTYTGILLTFSFYYYYYSYALPCLGPLAPRRAVGARHDGLPRQFSPHFCTRGNVGASSKFVDRLDVIIVIHLPIS